MKRAPTQAVILAGGLGTRLGEITKVTPKPLLSVLGVPFIEHLIRNVVRFGFTDVLLLCGYRADLFEPLTAPGLFGRARVSLSIEPPTLLGTGGALRHAAALLDDVFLFMNGDTFFDVNLLDLTSEFRPANERVRIALRPQPNEGRYGSVALDGDRIVAFGSEAPSEEALINGGIYCMHRDVVGDIVADGPCSLEKDVFPVLAARGLMAGRVYRGAPFLDIGIPSDLEKADAFIAEVRTRPAAFLDRDGVLNVDCGYTHKVEQLIWTAGAKNAVKALNDRGYYVFVVTNQAGVARGFYDCAQVERFHDHMNEELRSVGAHIDAFEYCPYHPDGTAPQYSRASPRRKPEPGMIFDLLQSWPIDAKRSFLIGDKASDVEAAIAANVEGYKFESGNLREFFESTVAFFTREIG